MDSMLPPVIAVIIISLMAGFFLGNMTGQLKGIENMQYKIAKTSCGSFNPETSKFEWSKNEIKVSN